MKAFLRKYYLVSEKEWFTEILIYDLEIIYS